MQRAAPSRRVLILLFFMAFIATCAGLAQQPSLHPDITRMQGYQAHRASSSDPTGGNADWRTIQPNATLTLLDVDGPGTVTHLWFALSHAEEYHLKKLVLRAYWDNEESPSVETTVGDFFGEHFGDYRAWSSELLSVGPDRALNSFFPMPYRKHARITLTNEGEEEVGRAYFNVDYVTHSHALPSDTLYFHAAFTQAQPAQGWTNDWRRDTDTIARATPNLDGKGNFNWLEAKGEGQYIGVVLSVLQNQNGWWGEGDDMFFIDGEKRPSIAGTGSEDYFLGAFDWGSTAYTTPHFGAFRLGEEHIGSRYTVYRFHTEEPITFQHSIVAGMEHGNANHRSDNYYATSYWYQKEPHAPLPALPPISERVPEVRVVGGPGALTPESETPRPEHKIQ